MLISDLAPKWAPLFAGAAVASYALGWVVLAALRRWRVMDLPNARSSHAQPTPRGGGAAIMLTFVGGACWLTEVRGSSSSWLVVGLAVVVAVLSFCDDRFDLSWRTRLGGHLLVAVVGALWFRPEIGWIGWLLVPVLVLLLAGYANAFNFMDGINGIAAGQALVAGVTLAVLALEPGGGWHPAGAMALLLAGASAGFVPHNFPRARIFMGDVGSVSLGMTLMLLSVWLARDRGSALWVPMLAAHSGFILDTGFTLAWRWWRGERLHEAHREHFYQRLVRCGWSHVKTTSLYTSASALVVIGAVAIARSGGGAFWTAGLCVVIWGTIFGFAGIVFRRSSPS